MDIINRADEDMEELGGGWVRLLFFFLFSADDYEAERRKLETFSRRGKTQKKSSVFRQNISTVFEDDVSCDGVGILKNCENTGNPLCVPGDD